LKIYSLVILTLSFFISSDLFAKNCQEVRTGFDIGSGATKIMVAKIDFCEKKILEILLNESRPVSFNEDFEKSADKKLSDAIIAQGQKVLGELYEISKKFKPKRVTGVATSVFRKAHNGIDVIKNYSKNLKFKIEIVSQIEEASLGYISAISQLKTEDSSRKDILVWDIGGGSMQMYTHGDDNRALTYLGELASVTFKNMIIEVIQQKKLNEVSSPNPIGDKAEQALALARSYAKLHVPHVLQEKIKDRFVVGVGGVHGQSLKNQMQLKEMKYSLENLSTVSLKEAKKSDKDLSGDYRATDVSNLILVQGFMEGLGIKEVTLVNASLLQGVLLR
jgi:exopolyphosphatase/guanosine-5'-triphosphate,3'-diphosphate pyrophosphatase